MGVAVGLKKAIHESGLDPQLSLVSSNRYLLDAAATQLVSVLVMES